MRHLFLASLLLGGATGAFAQTAPVLLISVDERSPSAPPIDAHAARRSVLVAFALDAGIFAASGLVANALIMTPCTTGRCYKDDAGTAVLYASLAAAMTAGHLYAGDPRRALIGLGIRTAGMGFVVWGNSQNDGGLAIIPDEPGYLIGVPLLLAGTAYSLVTTPRSVRDFNARPAVTVGPSVGQSGEPTLTLVAQL